MPQVKNGVNESNIDAIVRNSSKLLLNRRSSIEQHSQPNREQEMIVELVSCLIRHMFRFQNRDIFTK